jgi:hypothetical protein
MVGFSSSAGVKSRSFRLLLRLRLRATAACARDSPARAPPRSSVSFLLGAHAAVNEPQASDIHRRSEQVVSENLVAVTFARVEPEARLPYQLRQDKKGADADLYGVSLSLRGISHCSVPAGVPDLQES